MHKEYDKKENTDVDDKNYNQHNLVPTSFQIGRFYEENGNDRHQRLEATKREP